MSPDHVSHRIDAEDEATDVDRASEALRDALVADLDAGFTQVFRAYERIVYSVAVRMTDDRAEAEDVAAEAFLRGYRALRDYDEARIRSLRLVPWLVTITRNAARNRARDAARRPARGPADEPLDPPDTAPGVERRVEQSDAHHELELLVSQLPDAQRLAVVLRHVVGLSTAEVADALGCPEGTAKSHLSRGLERLRTITLTSGREPR